MPKPRIACTALLLICVPAWRPMPLRATEASPNFSRDVAPILYRRCATCHHAGEVAPFALLSYRDAKLHARQIAAAVEKRYMPPWQAEAGAVAFSNDRRLTDAEIHTLTAWNAAGAPEGDARTAPAAPKFYDGWQLGKPDQVLNMPVAFPVPAGGKEMYRCFVIPAGLVSERYVRAVEFRPETPGVIHHAIVVQDPHQAGRRLEKRPGEGYPCGGGFGFAMPGMLTMWTAGTVAHADPPGIAVLLKKGSDLVVQLHIRPRRDAALAKVRIGLYFAAQSAAREPVDLSVTSYDVDVPAGEATHRVRAFSYVPTDVDAYSIFAHAHYLATAFRVTATLPDGEVKLLLSIKHWNFDWQENYWFTSPVRLPEGTRLDMEVVYDNSAGNPRNPNSPPKRVTWGFLTTDEMCEVHLRGVAVDPLAHVMTEMTH